MLYIIVFIISSLCSLDCCWFPTHRSCCVHRLVDSVTNSHDIHVGVKLSAVILAYDIAQSTVNVRHITGDWNYGLENDQDCQNSDW